MPRSHSHTKRRQKLHAAKLQRRAEWKSRNKARRAAKGAEVTP